MGRARETCIQKLVKAWMIFNFLLASHGKFGKIYTRLCADIVSTFQPGFWFPQLLGSIALSLFHKLFHWGGVGGV